MNFDFSDVIEDVKAALKKDKRTDSLDKVMAADNMTEVSRDPKDYVVMPEWWEEQYGVLGLPFGKIVQIAGDSDTGKTSLCITAMKAAQAQGYGIVYVETELKTSKQDLESWGVDPRGVLLVQTNITEEAYDLSFRMINAFFGKYPKGKLLYIFDSIGNNVSMRDDELDLVNGKQKPGGHATTNRLGIGRLIAMMNKNPIAVLLVNYDYDNMGSHGKTQAGGKALKFYTMIGIQSQRTADWTKTVAKQLVKVGAYVKWTTFKNHFQKAATDKEGKPRLLAKAINLQISAAGIERSAKGDDEG
jgi:RecA/RadA recombinase